MATSQRVNILTDRVEELSILLEYLKNPKLIDQLKDEVKILNSLTESESQKITEARKFMSEYDKTISEHITRQNILEKDIADFLKKSENLALEIKKNNDFSMELSIKSQSLTDLDRALGDARTKLVQERTALEKKISDDRAQVVMDQQSIQKDRVLNEAEKNRLRAASEELKDKADKIKGLVG